MKQKLVIHQPTNHSAKTFRDYNFFFDDLINDLNLNHDIVVDRFFKRANMGFNSVELQLIDGPESNILMLECEMIIENLSTDEIFIFSVSDDLTPAILNLQKNPKVKKVFVSQFIREKIYHHVNEEYQEKYYPWIYFPSYQHDFKLYNKINSFFPEKIDKMYFRGSASYRPIMNYLDKTYFEGGDAIGGFEAYSKDLIKYKVALSIAGRGELCYRDVECMAMGIPLLRFEYLSELYQPLVPNVHYISVDRPDDLKSWKILDREGNEEHAKLLVEKYISIKDDLNFINQISLNARSYYDEFLSKESRIKLTKNLINL
jgi:hypothetical protein